MNAATDTTSNSRRSFLKQSSLLAGSALLSTVSRRCYAGEDNTIRLALIGCGGRGSGAVANAVSATGGPVTLYAMADLFEDKLTRSYSVLRDQFEAHVDVPRERQFLGFDAYKHAIDCLRPGDVVLLTTNAYCRPTHLDYAVDRGLNVFMEKSFAPDPVGLHRMLRAGARAKQQNLKIAAGLMCRHSVARQAFVDKVRNGELGDVLLIRAARLGGAAHLGPKPAERNEIEWQIRNKTYFPWVSSGRFIEYLIHQVDECCWLKDSFPIAAHGLGGRIPHSPDCGQNLDTYSIEYTFADGSKAMVTSRDMHACESEFATFVHGTRRAGQFSGQVHRATVHLYKDQRQERSNIDWQAEDEPCTPWQAEWNVLLSKIRGDEPHNETERAINSNFAAIMGRAAAHYGRTVTWDEVRDSEFAFCPGVDALTFDSPSPVTADAEGRYPAPVPGSWTEL